MPYSDKQLKEAANRKPAPQYYNAETDDYEVVQGANGAPRSIAATVPVTFHDAAPAVSSGTAFTVGPFKTLTIEIYGTSTSRTVNFFGKGPAGVRRALQGVKLSDYSIAISTTGTAEFWQFDITGLSSVEIELAAVAGGNVSVKGTAVA